MSSTEESFENGEGDSDPRVQDELERLNNAGTEINIIETSLTKARQDYQTTLHRISHDLRALEKSLGSSVKNARPYYEARIKFKQALQEVQEASEKFEHASSRHNAAREMVAVAEASLERHVGTRPEDKLAWAEMLNSATEKVNAAEKERQDASKLHTDKIQKFQDIERLMTGLQKSLKRSIISSKPYFEKKLNKMSLVDEKRNKVYDFEQQLHISKSDYQAALRTLETISEQIHLQRKLQSLEINSNMKEELITNINMTDTSSCRSVLSDLRRADSVEHIDNMSEPSDIDQNDRLSVDSGMWTPGSGGGSRHGSGRRTHTRNASMPLGTRELGVVPAQTRESRTSPSSSSSDDVPTPRNSLRDEADLVTHFASERRPTVRSSSSNIRSRHPTPISHPAPTPLVSLDVKALQKQI